METHPLNPFLPKSARALMLGTFPPKREKWCMDFFYPNAINDMWRIFGLAFFGDRDFFWDAPAKRFRKDKIAEFLERAGIALYDTAAAVNRLKDNASDNFLEIVERTDLAALLAQIPACKAVVCTGAKAAETAAEAMGCRAPKQGEMEKINFAGRDLKFYRMPSSSRAYPMKLEKKAEIYSAMFGELGFPVLK